MSSSAGIRRPLRLDQGVRWGARGLLGINGREKKKGMESSIFEGRERKKNGGTSMMGGGEFLRGMGGTRKKSVDSFQMRSEKKGSV